MDIEKEIAKIPRMKTQKPVEKSGPIALLTPNQKAILDGTVNPVILELIERFGLDTNAHSSLQALDTLKINHRVDTLFAQLSESTPPPPLDLSKYSPLGPEDQHRLKERIQQKKLSTLPKGLTIDQKGNTTFDLQWKQKGIHPTELPPDHPDYTPF